MNKKIIISSALLRDVSKKQVGKLSYINAGLLLEEEEKYDFCFHPACVFGNKECEACKKCVEEEEINDL